MPSSAPGAPHPGDPDDKMRASLDRLRAFADHLDANGDAEMARLSADELVSTRARDAPQSVRSGSTKVCADRTLG